MRRQEPEPVSLQLTAVLRERLAHLAIGSAYAVAPSLPTIIVAASSELTIASSIASDVASYTGLSLVSASSEIGHYFGLDEDDMVRLGLE